jgi:hypothetical protein
MLKIFRYLFPACIIILCLMVNPFKGKADNESQCVSCHTNAKKLIEITREIAETRPVLKETEQKGEG